MTCFSEDRGKPRAKARGISVPFTGCVPDLQPGPAEATSRSAFEERSEELDVLNNTATLRRSAEHQRPRRGRGRLDAWARLRSFCMEWARLMVLTRLRVLGPAFLHVTRMSHTLAGRDVGVRAEQVKSFDCLASAAAVRPLAAPLARIVHGVCARGGARARVASESAAGARSTWALRGAPLHGGRC